MKTSVKLISLLVANAFAVAPAFADGDDFKWSGEVGIGARGVSTDGGTRDGAYANGASATPTATPFTGPEDKAKFNEFRDLKHSTPIGIVDVRGSNSRYYVNMYGENFALKDQFLDVQGGRYGDFKYRLYNDNMPHSYSWGALTPMNGSGTGLQTVIAQPGNWNPNSAVLDPHNNPNNWNSVDVGWKRNTYGGNFEFSGNSPWYVRADAQEIITKGNRQISYPFTQSSGAGWIDLVAPVDYRTRNLALEGGYKVKQGFISVNVSRSSFYNDQESLTFQDPKFGNGLMTVPLPPDNESTKVGVNGAWRQLPLSSTLSGRWSYTRLTNSFNPQQTSLTGGTIGGTNPTFTTDPVNSTNFNGKKTTNTGGLSWVANPLHGFDTKLFYNWYNRDNSGNNNVFVTPTAPFLPPYLNYRNSTWGLDLGYRFNEANRLQGGFEDRSVSRNQLFTVNAGSNPAVGTGEPWVPTKTNDQKWWLEYKNTSLDWLTGRLKYENVNRSSKNYLPAAYTTTSVTNVNLYQNMDTANFDQNRVSLFLDFSPMPFLDFGFQGIVKDTDYTKSYGIQSDKRSEYVANVSYGDARVFRVSGFADWENVTAKDNWFGGTLGGPTTTTGNFQFTTKQKTTNKMFGIAADWPVREKLLLNASYIWSKTGGGVDFTNNASAATLATTTFFNGTLPPFVTDNTTKNSLVLKGRYDMDRKWAFTGGYSYERYKYNDDQMNGYFGYYPYYMVASTTNTAIMNGVWTNPSYTAHVLWFTARYKFD